MPGGAGCRAVFAIHIERGRVGRCLRALVSHGANAAKITTNNFQQLLPAVSPLLREILRAADDPALSNARQRIACGQSAVAPGQDDNTQTQHRVDPEIECRSVVECSTASKKKMTPHARCESREGITTRHDEIANLTRTTFAFSSKPRTRT